MATSNAPYDPIFYSLHAYIDLLFWKWQNRHSNGDLEIPPTDILNANLIPFNTKQKHIVDSETQLCVSYIAPKAPESYNEEPIMAANNDRSNYATECFSTSMLFENSCENEIRTLVDVGHRIQSVLYNQEEKFLKTLPRVCHLSTDPTEIYSNQMWNVQSTDFEIQNNFQNMDLKNEWCERFCFTADIFLPLESEDSSKTSCSLNETPICDESSLLKCPYYTYAPCRLSLCGNCSLICHVNDEDIECDESKIDFCKPNPCKNDGQCIPSQWPTLPHLISCNCPPSYEGDKCEQESSLRCSLPQIMKKSPEGCGKAEKRWYFDLTRQDCFSFLDDGCSRTTNNFPTYYECRSTCMIGACCWKEPRFKNRVPGFNVVGYDRYGFTPEGRSSKNEVRTLDNGFGGDKGIFRYKKFDYEGYDKNGYNVEGINRHGYDSNGYHSVTKFNLSGYNIFGDHDGRLTFNVSGFNKDGYNRAGFNCLGYTRDGWDYYGLSAGWSFSCQAMSLMDCQNTEKESSNLFRKVINFSPGKKCEEVLCHENCGCSFLQKSYSIGEKFSVGCNICECTISGGINCDCKTISIRKEIRDMTLEELKRYQNALKALVLQKPPSTWQNLTSLYREFLPQSRENNFFLPWHRFFLRFVEMKLQEIDCSVTIPYFDWTMDVGSLQTSVVWQANYFGGDGDKSRDYCVKNHPFKNFRPLYWDSCLRRNFNSSVFLPNAVDLVKILRIQSFDEFSFEINRISGLFHLFVNGHMGTMDSSYDPIFYSHYAFIDKLWNDWMSQSLNNIQKFPHKFRYVPLDPFGIFPDDVLRPELQLCVAYKGITEGAPCVDGSKNTLDDFRSLNIKPRVIDVDGYDTEGYDSNGYDRMGWNKKGIFRDTFDRDGYDASGFDRKGFNRFGFNRNGCNIKGICMTEQKYNSRIKDIIPVWTEFNEFGYHPTGFDFHGYDNFGFDINGYDQDNCSYFFSGPFYPIFMKQAYKKLKSLNNDKLDKIKSTCPYMSDVPKWWLNLYWLNRNSRKETNQVPRTLEHIFSPFSKEDDVWLAPTPDERFCFQLHHHSKCDLDQPPVPCPLMTCSTQVCPSMPSAHCRNFGCGSCDANYLNIISQTPTSCNKNDCISVDGNVKADGEVWEEELCYTCSCQAGLVSCSGVHCEINCDHPVINPGSCCPICDGCLKNDILYGNGESFVDPQNPCLKCMCASGSIVCTNVECAPMQPCMKNALVTLPGKCCPTCSMCGPHREGSYWMESPCHNCSCDAGKVNCSVINCPLPICQYPARTSEECCRHCDDCEYRGNQMKNEEVFTPEPCIECKCQKGDIACAKIDCSHPICNEPRSLYDQCCNQCRKDCQYDGRHYEDGTIFNPSFNPCLNCSCEKGLVRCLPTKCSNPQVTCEVPVFKPGGCCPECPKCLFHEREYTNGQRWKLSNDSCKTCVCMNGVVTCSEQGSCPNQKCTHGVIPDKQCCSPCIDCKYNNHLVLDKMQFSPPDDPCARCMCQKGNITCVRETCPKLNCQATVLPADSCCPVCKGCINSVGQTMEHGQKWVHHSDACQLCTCLDGVARCERIACTIPCTHPVMKPDVCCPECKGCQVLGKIYEMNAEISSSDPCQRCYCYSGNMECETVSCPTMTCDNPKREAGSCCLKCDECNFRGHVYKNGEVFQPKSDPCYTCTCDKGAVHCGKKNENCNPQCRHPVKLPGQCCPVCDGCEYDDHVLKNDEEFIPNPDEPCLRCKCNNGDVMCYQHQCPKVTCSNPVQLPGECCKQCLEYCIDEQHQEKTYSEGEVWLSSTDDCIICMCKDSIVRCQRVDCPDTLCLHPAAPFGVCCPECDHCEFTHRLYRNGQEFPHEDDPCQICKCENGTITCETIICDPLPCPRPENLEGLCCPICSPDVKCHGDGKTYDAWENFLDPNNPCSECVCVDGMFSCHPVLCLNTECSNPQLGHCCESCEGCSYSEKNYLNHMTFRDPHNDCRDCQCESGVVSCQQRLCGVTGCEHPVYSEGECCPMCRDTKKCSYKENLYEDGERFVEPEDSCVECYCQYPEVHCEYQGCSEDSCIDTPHGGCRDAKCQFFEDMKESGSVFTHPQNSCEVCTCQSGMVTCFEHHCPPIRCSHPVRTNCCSICSEGCLYAGSIYEEWEVFLDLQDRCQECRCQNGNVTCTQKPCPSTTCDHPSSDGCCPVCEDCLYDGKKYESGTNVPRFDLPCETCICDSGSIKCNPKICVKANCSNPVIKDCCQSCDSGCMDEDQIYANGTNFQYHNSPCELCSCINGNILCNSKPCDFVHCSHPVVKNCCPVCDSGCLYNRKIVEIGENFTEPNNPCEICICNSGNIECKPKTCEVVYCSDPVIDNCCPVCNLGCFYEGKVYDIGAEFDHPIDSCSECACMKGTVHCDRKPCDAVECANVIEDDQHCCPYCPDFCEYNGQRYSIGDVFPHETETCKECLCKNGDILCTQKVCSKVLCLHPAPGECCPECTNCLFFGDIYTDKTNFTNPENSCETCLCSRGQVACERTPCVQCLHPIVNDSSCCPICDGCFFEGMNITNQQRFVALGDPCEECICKNGTVTCHKLSCSRPTCANPVILPGECCPVCPGCTVSGIHFDENQEFNHPEDVCEKCICKDSQYACTRQICEKNCTHPTPDPCCPLCTDCTFERKRYLNGEKFHPDSCRSCECKDGNVVCVTESCPVVTCQLRVRLPGQCCEVCRGCVHEGTEYENNASWISTSNPCLSCTCKGGTPTCANIVCPIECVEPIPVPGQCCPVCPDCEKDGIKYKSGERFSPISRPCDTCTCDSGHVFCIRHECPVLIGCPEESIKPPGIGECCPTCAAFGTSCVRDQIGQLFHPYPDPCFVCQCSDNFMWVCSKEFCPPMNCPPAEVIKNDKECCPKCRVCISEGNEIHLHGDSWSSPNDPCNYCLCEYGFLKCNRAMCPELNCGPDETEFRSPGECCALCVSSINLACYYGATYYEHGQTWKPDPCTTCQCFKGKMNCHNERCIPLDCSSDEIRSVDPGQCCPKCTPRPATCIAFGDPHYRTFDGASISFQGTCRYVFTADCYTQKFSVMVENNNRGFDGVSWTHRVVVVLQNASVDLRAGPTVYVRGRHIEILPYFEDPILYIERTGQSVLVTTDVGVQILWNGDGFVEVTVSGLYRGKTCGLCGNFNNFLEDDMRTPTNQTVTSEAKFGDSWKYGDVQPSGCTESVDIDPCSKGGYRIRKAANTKCSILKLSLFAPCHRLIRPEPFFAACVYDVCACSENDDCLCDILSTYSKECSKAGVILNWRSEGLCGIHCSEEEGLVFDECGPACPRTCENRYLSIGILASQCFKPCIPGCQCSADKVLHNGRCIRPQFCP